jgi:hypothetical protein
MSAYRWIALSIALLGVAAGAIACQDDDDAALEAACSDGKQDTPDCQAAFAAAMNTPEIVEKNRRADAYRLALATSLASRNTPDALLASAVAVKWLEVDIAPIRRSVAVPPAMSSAALLARAAALAPADARPWFLAIGTLRCAPVDAPCAKDAAIARLLQVDPDNAAAWLLSFQREAERGDAAAARASLARAARAPVFRDYVDAIDQVVLREWLSDPTELRVGPHESKSTLTEAQFARWNKLFESTTSFGTPGDYYLAKACDPASAAKDDPALQADCRAIGAMKDTAGAGLFSQSQGRFLQMRLATDPAERERFEVGVREIRWLIHEGSWGETADPAKIEEEIAMRLAGTGDVAIRRHIAAARGLVFSPDWRPPPMPYERAKAEAAESADAE